MNKTKRIDVKVTEEQFKALTKKAADFSMNLSEWKSKNFDPWKGAK